MALQLTANQELLIDGMAYRIAEHPAAPGMPYGQEGRAATVYQLVAGAERRALKVFKPRFQVPGLVTLADQLAPLAALLGLRVCERRVLTPRRHPALLRQYPDLIYAVLMPWVAGPTWMELLLDQRALRPEESLALARALAEVLAGMEERRLAHCDLSAPNLILPALADSAIRNPHAAIELVDVEQMYGPGLDRPDGLPAGSPGYAHRTAPRGLWAANADRFAGGLLLAEMLGWCDARVRAAAWGESYFDPAEMQQEGTRYQTLLTALRERWGEDVAGLFKRAWAGDTLADCPTFGTWLVTLPEEVPATSSITASPAPGPAANEVGGRVLLDLARDFAARGNPSSALETYKRALELAPAGSGLAEEIAGLIRNLAAPPPRLSARPPPSPALAPATLIKEEQYEPERTAPVPQPERARRMPIRGAGFVVLCLLLGILALPAGGPLHAVMFGSYPTVTALPPPAATVTAVAVAAPTDTEVPPSPIAPTDTVLPPPTNTANAPPVRVAGTAVPGPLVAISAANADQITEVAEWGLGAAGKMAYSPDGGLIAVGSPAGVHLYEGNTLAETQFWATGAYVNDLAFTPDGQALALGLATGAEIRRVTDGTVIRTLKQGEIRAISISPDGQLIALSNIDSVELWKVTDGTLVRKLDINYTLEESAFSPDGQIIATGGWQEAKLWRVVDGQLMHTLSTPGWADTIVFAPDDRTLAISGGGYGRTSWTAQLWNTSDGTLLRELNGHTDSIWGMAYSPNGKTLATASDDGTIRLWQPEDGALLAKIGGYRAGVRGLAYSRDGQKLALALSDGGLRVWRASDGASLAAREGHPVLSSNLAVSSDGQLVAFGTESQEIQIRRVSDWSLAQTLTGKPGSVYRVAFSPDGQLVASSSTDMTIRLWQIATGEMLRSLEGSSEILQDPAFAPDGKTIAAFSDQDVYLWEVSTGKLLRKLSHPAIVRSLAFAPGSGILATGDDDQSVRLWRPSDGTLLHELASQDAGQYAGTDALAFSPDGRTLVTGARDGSVRLWRMDNYAELHKLAAPSIDHFAISSDGKVIAVASYNNVQLWSAEDGLALPSPQLNTTYLYSPCFALGNKLLIGGTMDSRIRFLGIPP